MALTRLIDRRLGERLFDSARLLDFLRYSRNMSGVLPFDPQEIGLPIRCDNRLMAARVVNGETPELFEVVELMAGCRTLYDLATLVARELGTTKDCLRLWRAVRSDREVQTFGLERQGP
jgi:hypothetical protein